jgi:hypothetical protein
VWSARLDRRYLAIVALAIVWLGALGAWHLTHAAPVAMAAAFDLVVTAGAVAYWLGVRGRALGFVVAAGMLAAKLVLGRVLIVAAIVELATLAIVAVRIERARVAWRAATSDRLRAALAAVLPRVAAEIVATELIVVHAAFAGWRVARSDAFTVHRTSSWPLIAGVLAALTLIEAPLMHLALRAFGLPTLAWTASALSLYGAIWLVGDANALRRGGLRIAGRELVVALGTRWRGAIDVAAITRAHLASGPAELDVAIATPNVVIELREPARLVGLFGRTKLASSIAFELDEPEAFVAQLAPYLRA